MSTYTPTDQDCSTKDIPSICPTDSPFNFKTEDMQIIVTYHGDRIIGTVSSHSMAQASTVWKKFIYPPWEEIKESATLPKQKAIDCSEDDDYALLTLLNIAHLKFDSLPTTALTTHSLFNLAILVDQYQCIDLVRPWLGTWLCDEKELIRSGAERWLFTAWVFGREKRFEEASAQLVRRATTLEGKLYNSDTGMHFPDLIPPGITESIYKVRLETIAKLLDIAYSKARKYENTGGITVCKFDSERCDALSYGSLTLSLMKKDLLHRKTPDEIYESVNELASHISSLKVLLELTGGTTHFGCFDTDLNYFKSNVDKIMSEIESSVLDSHRIHMKVQRGEKD